jgi:hypothetical protein
VSRSCRENNKFGSDGDEGGLGGGGSQPLVEGAALKRREGERRFPVYQGKYQGI